MFLTIIFLSLFSAVCLALMLLFYLRSERMQDKLNKTEDNILENKKELFSKKKSIMRTDELQLFRLLEERVGEKYYIFPQVHFTELIAIANGIKDHDNLYQI